MSEFHRTRMGQTFFESTMPALVQQLARLNANLEKLIKQNEPEIALAERPYNPNCPYSSHADDCDCQGRGGDR